MTLFVTLDASQLTDMTMMVTVTLVTSSQADFYNTELPTTILYYREGWVQVPVVFSYSNYEKCSRFLVREIGLLCDTIALFACAST